MRPRHPVGPAPAPVVPEQAAVTARAPAALASQRSCPRLPRGCAAAARSGGGTWAASCATPGVSAQPGCIACTTIPVAAEALGPQLGEHDLRSLAVRVGGRAAVVTALGFQIEGSSRAVYMPPDDTLMTLDGAPERSWGRSSLVSTNIPSTFVANVSSCPSAERSRSPASTPALLMSTCTPRCRDEKREANARTEARLLRSASSTCTSRSPPAAICSAALSPRSLSRTRMCTSPPRS